KLQILAEIDAAPVRRSGRSCAGRGCTPRLSPNGVSSVTGVRWKGRVVIARARRVRIRRALRWPGCVQRTPNFTRRSPAQDELIGAQGKAFALRKISPPERGLVGERRRGHGPRMVHTKSQVR